jgi:hypothetical protein
MKRAGEDALQLLHETAASVYEQSAAGANPTQCVIKASKEASMTKAWTERLCEVTNRLLTVDHLENAPADKRAAAHPLVNKDEVLETLFPATLAPAPTRKAASAGNPFVTYTYRDVFSSEKAASTKAAADEKDMDPLGGSNEKDILQRAIGLQRTLKLAAGEVGTITYAGEQRVSSLADICAKAVKKACIPLQTLEERALHWFGKDTIKAADILAVRLPVQPRFKAASPRTFTTAWPKDASPYKEFSDLLIAAREEALRIKLAQDTAAVATKFARLIDLKLNHISKQAAGKVSELGSHAINEKVLSALVPEGGDKGESSSGDLDLITAGVKPEDAQFANSIQARMALVGALKDPVIARRDLSDVVKAYNRFADTSPRAFMHESSLTSLLRHTLEQPDQAPHDLAQMQQLEKGLAAQDDITNASNR